MKRFLLRARRGASGEVPFGRLSLANLRGIGANVGPTERLAWQGAFWTILTFGGSQLIRLAASLITTRLLFPELFGLMAIVQTILTGLGMFSDVGLATSVVRHERGEERSFLNTVFTMQAVRGFALWLMCIALAWPVASFYDDSRLIWLLPAVGLTAVINGLQSTSLLVFKRRMAVRQLTLLEITSQIITVTVIILWAVVEPTVLALVVGPWVGSLFMVAASHLLNRPHRDRFIVDRTAAADLFSFGKWIFLSTIFTFLAGQSDRLILGKLFSLELLGIYNIAFLLADVPRALMSALSSKVLFPGFARLRDLPRAEMRAKVGRRRPLLLGLAAFGLAIVVSCGDLVVELLYDRRWSDAAWMLPILALGVWPAMLTLSIDPVFFVIGKAQVPTAGSAVRFVALLMFTLIGALMAGPVGAIAGICLSAIPQYFVTLYGLQREQFAFVRQDVFATLFFVALTSSLFCARMAVHEAPMVFSALRTL